MRFPAQRGLIATLVALLVFGGLSLGVVAEAPATATFQRTWAYTDQPVAGGTVSRTWMWGPTGNTGALQESYDEAPGGQRTVQYFDKSRMEDNSYRAAGPPWDVSNGLLVMELVTGREQLGDNHFEQYPPAQVNVAGDSDDTGGPTYATFEGLLDVTAGNAQSAIVQVLDRAGNITIDQSKAAYGIPTVHFVPETQHWIAGPFWDFMNATGPVYENGNYFTAPLFLNPYYATGFPISEPYWARVKVGGAVKDVLIQCFERRCLTYTPENAPEWRVEMGNVGQHYHHWRYVEIPGSGAAPCPDSPEGVYVWVADLLNDRIQKFDQNGGFICQWYGDYDYDGPMARPQALAVDPRNNDLWVNAIGLLQRFDRQGRLLGSIDGGFNFNDIAIDSLGNIYGVDLVDAEIEKYAPTGAFITAWGSQGSGEGQFDSPTGIAIDAANNIYVADRNNHRIQKFTSNGDFLAAWTPDDDLWGFPASVAVDDAGYIYATSIRVYKLGPDGTLLDIWGEVDDITGSGDIAVGADGDVYAWDANNTMLRVFTSDGVPITSWGSSGSEPGQFSSVPGIATSTR